MFSPVTTTIFRPVSVLLNGGHLGLVRVNLAQVYYTYLLILELPLADYHIFYASLVAILFLVLSVCLVQLLKITGNKLRALLLAKSP